MAGSSTGSVRGWNPPRSLWLSLSLIGSALILVSLARVGMQFYLEMLMVGVAFQSVSAFLSFQAIHRNSSATNVFIVNILIVSAVLNIMRSVRFNVLSGVDILEEYSAARITYEQGKWSIGLAFAKDVNLVAYYKSISVSVFPSMISSMTGLDLLEVFKILPGILGCMIPVVLFLVLRETFTDLKIAAVAAILFSQFYYNFFLLSQVVRQQFGELFLLLVILLIFMSMRLSGKRRSLLLALSLFLFGIVWSHYTSNYFSIVVLPLMLLSPYVLHRLPRRAKAFLRLEEIEEGTGRAVSSTYVLLIFALMSAVWLTFVSLDILSSHVSDFQQVVLTILEIRHARPSNYILKLAPEGIGKETITVWFVMQAVLIVAGFVLVTLREKKGKAGWIWVFGGLLALAMMAGAFVSPEFSLKIYPDRIYTYGFLFFSSFLAYGVSRLDKGRKRTLLAAFLLLNLPMQMLLPAHDAYVFYTPERSVNVEDAAIEAYNRLPEFSLGAFVRAHVRSSEAVSIDIRGRWAIFYVDNPYAITAHPGFEEGSHYVVLHYFANEYGIWVRRDEAKRLTTQPRMTNEIMELADESNIVYSNGDSRLLMQSSVVWSATS